MKRSLLCSLLLAFCSTLPAQSPPALPSLEWRFETNWAGALLDSALGGRAPLTGNVAFVPGVQGQCLLLDGLTAFASVEPAQVPKISGPFSVQAWVALAAYPLAQAPLVDLHEQAKGGFYFGIDAHGRLELGVQSDAGWQNLTASQPLPLRQWRHLAGVFEPASGLSLYVDGRPVGQLKVQGAFKPAEGLELLMGRHRIKQKPEGPVRADSTGVVFDFLDGALDELKIYPRALSAEEVLQAFQSAAAPAQAPLPPRVLPAGPPGPGPFGAFYTHLKFYPQWDKPWRVGDYPDVVVRFESSPLRLVFWRGTSYIPNWVTENGIWYNNEFNETWSGVLGCGEPMSDKQCRFSNVRVIESSEARAVVHWRYALVDVFYTHARLDPLTGWGDWTDEVHTIYPDGTSVREITLHSTNPEQPHEWQESIVVMGPGFSPDNSIEPAGVTLLDETGQGATYSWKDSTPAAKPGKPAHPCIQLINTKSRYRPFAIVRPQDKPDFDVYAGEIRRDVTLYPWWNHWPAATFPSDGRYALAADRTSHSSLTHLFWEPYQQGPEWMRKVMLAGLTEQSATNLLPLMRSWSKPAALSLKGQAFQSQGYDPAQKAYVLRRSAPAVSAVQFDLAASSESPVLNPAFVLKNWGASQARLTLDGKLVKRSAGVRFGFHETLEGIDLVVWLPLERHTPVRFSLSPD